MMAGNRRKDTDLLSPRVGFHYFPDTDHYTQKDLATWLPILKQLHAAWLILVSDAVRAIPEHFITGLVNAGIKPIVHLRLPLPNSPSAKELKPIFNAYARWGVKHVILFEKPNNMQSWSTSGWVQQDLVERFIDRFLPLATVAAQSGITPIFPPLEPGGSYWDLSFLKQSLQSMQRRGYTNLLNQMGIAAYAFTYNHDLDYGAGGPQKWPHALPYAMSLDSQDQRGFRNYEWLQSAANSTLARDLPVFLLGAGIKEPGKAYSPEVHAGICLNILGLLNGSSTENALPGYVQNCSFYALSAALGTADFLHAWFRSEDEVLPIVDLLTNTYADKNAHISAVNIDEGTGQVYTQSADHPIEHYLLLPLYDWGVADYHLEVTRPFIQRHHPTVGFSIEEAALARKVTVIGGEQTFPEEQLSRLRAGGSIVERITGDGISIATQLAER
jgi:hypothetical protein